jgi:hypothetical protein
MVRVAFQLLKTQLVETSPNTIATAGPPIFTLIQENPVYSKRDCDGSKDSQFVVALIDPDVPAPFPEVRQFFGGNFNALDFKLGPQPDGTKIPQLLVNSTPALSEFLQPAPPPGDPPHRYIFLVFNQPEGFNNQTLVTPQTDILSWNLTEFVDAVGLGDPIAGTYMLVGPDS